MSDSKTRRTPAASAATQQLGDMYRNNCAALGLKPNTYAVKLYHALSANISADELNSISDTEFGCTTLPQVAAAAPGTELGGSAALGTIECLDFSKTYLGANGVLPILPTLAHMPNLRLLNLANTGIRDVGCKELCAAIAHHKVLERVELSNNMLTMASVAALKSCSRHHYAAHMPQHKQTFTFGLQSVFGLTPGNVREINEPKPPGLASNQQVLDAAKEMMTQQRAKKKHSDKFERCHELVERRRAQSRFLSRSLQRVVPFEHFGPHDKWLTLGVFLATTWSEFPDELDAIHSVVMPRVNQRLAAHRVHLVAIDLHDHQQNSGSTRKPDEGGGGSVYLPSGRVEDKATIKARWQKNKFPTVPTTYMEAAARDAQVRQFVVERGCDVFVGMYGGLVDPVHSVDWMSVQTQPQAQPAILLYERTMRKLPQGIRTKYDARYAPEETPEQATEKQTKLQQRNRMLQQMREVVPECLRHHYNADFIQLGDDGACHFSIEESFAETMLVDLFAVGLQYAANARSQQRSAFNDTSSAHTRVSAAFRIAKDQESDDNNAANAQQEEKEEDKAEKKNDEEVEHAEGKDRHVTTTIIEAHKASQEKPQEEQQEEHEKQEEEIVVTHVEREYTCAITVQKCANLTDCEASSFFQGVSDPFVEVRDAAGAVLLTTEVISDDLSPQWTEGNVVTMRLQHEEEEEGRDGAGGPDAALKQKFVKLQVFNYNNVGSHDSLGFVDVNCEDFIPAADSGKLSSEGEATKTLTLLRTEVSEDGGSEVTRELNAGSITVSWKTTVEEKEISKTVKREVMKKKQKSANNNSNDDVPNIETEGADKEDDEEDTIYDVALTIHRCTELNDTEASQMLQGVSDPFVAVVRGERKEGDDAEEGEAEGELVLLKTAVVEDDLNPSWEDNNTVTFTASDTRAAGAAASQDVRLVVYNYNAVKNDLLGVAVLTCGELCAEPIVGSNGECTKKLAITNEDGTVSHGGVVVCSWTLTDKTPKKKEEKKKKKKTDDSAQEEEEDEEEETDRSRRLSTLLVPAVTLTGASFEVPEDDEDEQQADDGTADQARYFKLFDLSSDFTESTALLNYVVGPSGSGKTSQMAHFVEHLERSQEAQGGETRLAAPPVIVGHSVLCDGETTDIFCVAKALLDKLVVPNALNSRVHNSIEELADDFCAALEWFAHHSHLMEDRAAEDRKLYLLIDDDDEITATSITAAAAAAARDSSSGSSSVQKKKKKTTMSFGRLCETAQLSTKLQGVLQLRVFCSTRAAPSEKREEKRGATGKEEEHEAEGATGVAATAVFNLPSVSDSDAVRLIQYELRDMGDGARAQARAASNLIVLSKEEGTRPLYLVLAARELRYYTEGVSMGVITEKFPSKLEEFAVHSLSFRLPLPMRECLQALATLPPHRMNTLSWLSFSRGIKSFDDETWFTKQRWGCYLSAPSSTLSTAPTKLFLFLANFSHLFHLQPGKSVWQQRIQWRSATLMRACKAAATASGSNSDASSPSSSWDSVVSRLTYQRVCRFTPELTRFNERALLNCASDSLVYLSFSMLHSKQSPQLRELMARAIATAATTSSLSLGTLLEFREYLRMYWPCLVRHPLFLLCRPNLLPQSVRPAVREMGKNHPCARLTTVFTKDFDYLCASALGHGVLESRAMNAARRSVVVTATTTAQPGEQQQQQQGEGKEKEQQDTQASNSTENEQQTSVPSSGSASTNQSGNFQHVVKVTPAATFENFVVLHKTVQSIDSSSASITPGATDLSACATFGCIVLLPVEPFDTLSTSRIRPSYLQRRLSHDDSAELTDALHSQHHCAVTHSHAICCVEVVETAYTQRIAVAAYFEDTIKVIAPSIGTTSPSSRSLDGSLVVVASLQIPLSKLSAGVRGVHAVPSVALCPTFPASIVREQASSDGSQCDTQFAPGCVIGCLHNVIVWPEQPHGADDLINKNADSVVPTILSNHHDADVKLVGFSPAGTKVFSIDASGKCNVWSAPGSPAAGTVISQTSIGTLPSFARFCEDGVTIMFSTARSIQLWHTTTGLVSKIFDTATSNYFFNKLFTVLPYKMSRLTPIDFAKNASSSSATVGETIDRATSTAKLKLQQELQQAHAAMEKEEVQFHNSLRGIIVGDPRKQTLYVLKPHQAVAAATHDDDDDDDDDDAGGEEQEEKEDGETPEEQQDEEKEEKEEIPTEESPSISADTVQLKECNSATWATQAQQQRREGPGGASDAEAIGSHELAEEYTWFLGEDISCVLDRSRNLLRLVDMKGHKRVCPMWFAAPNEYSTTTSSSGSASNKTEQQQRPAHHHHHCFKQLQHVSVLGHNIFVTDDAGDVHVVRYEGAANPFLLPVPTSTTF